MITEKEQLDLILKKMPKMFSFLEFEYKVYNYKFKISDYKIRKYLKENCNKYDRIQYKK